METKISEQILDLAKMTVDTDYRHFKTFRRRAVKTPKNRDLRNDLKRKK